MKRTIITAVAAALLPIAAQGAGVFITGTTATADSSNGSATPIKALDGTGMSELTGLTTATHSNGDSTTGWLGGLDKLTDVTFTVTLGGSFDLDQIAVWNFTQNFDGGDNRGSKDVTISTSTDGLLFTALGDINGATTGTHTLAQGPNGGGGTPPTQSVSNVFAFTAVEATHVRFFIHNAYGTGTGNDRHLGLNEVRFYGDVTAVPEPSSTALLGLGGLALILRRRK